MPIYYFDTSAALKHYHSEKGTDEVRRIVHDSASSCILSRLTLTEMQRGFARRARQREITGNGLKQLRGILYTDLQQHHFRLIRVQEFHHHDAVRLFVKYWQQTDVPLLRTADALHLAVALRLRDRESLDYFVSADGNLCQIAEAEQLSVINPEAP